MKKILWLLGIVLPQCNTVMACSCAPPAPPAEELMFSDAVFSGVVTAVSVKKFEKKVTFEVDKIWKGFDAATIVVATGENGAMCGVNFDVGEKWLVYGRGEKQFSADLCSRTTMFQNAAQDLAALGEGRNPPPSPTRKILPIAFVLLAGVVTAWALRKWKK